MLDISCTVAFFSARSDEVGIRQCEAFTVGHVAMDAVYRRPLLFTASDARINRVSLDFALVNSKVAYDAAVFSIDKADVQLLIKTIDTDLAAELVAGDGVVFHSRRLLEFVVLDPQTTFESALRQYFFRRHNRRSAENAACKRKYYDHPNATAVQRRQYRESSMKRITRAIAGHFGLLAFILCIAPRTPVLKAKSSGDCGCSYAYGSSFSRDEVVADGLEEGWPV